MSNNNTPSITSVPTLKGNPLDKDIPPGAEPSTNALTPVEKTFTKAKPQEFPGTSPTNTGTLVVTSETPSITIRITTPNQPEGEGGGFVPSNITPFIYTDMPAGYYLIDETKDGYDESEVAIRIEPGKITRLSVSLQPFSSY